MSLWIEIPVALLLLLSAVMALAAALGLARLPSIFPRMHPPALTATLGTWCVTTAAVLYFSALDGGVAAYYWLVAIFMAITVPITTALLTRATLFRMHTQQTPNMHSPSGDDCQSKRT
jgi:multicomponent K+:H+ antiporter subunit G